MNEKPNIIIERVDDIPLLLAQMERMGLAALLETHFPTHGNWQGLGLGRVATIWLSSILLRGYAAGLTLITGLSMSSPG
jgi:hypothetical protein